MRGNTMKEAKIIEIIDSIPNWAYDCPFKKELKKQIRKHKKRWVKVKCKACKKEFEIVHSEIIDNVEGKAKITHYLINKKRKNKKESIKKND